MNPIKAQRIWKNLSRRWINATPYGYSPFRNTRRKRVKKGLLINLIPVEVVNAITGEISKGYMRDLSAKKLRKWLGFHNQRAQVEQVALSPRSTFYALINDKHPTDIKDFPILIKLGTYQVPYLIEQARSIITVKDKQTVTFELKTVDNLKYLQLIADKKPKVMVLFKKVKKRKIKKDKR
jgi:hypothetical protein